MRNPLKERVHKKRNPSAVTANNVIPVEVVVVAAAVVVVAAAVVVVAAVADMGGCTGDDGTGAGAGTGSGSKTARCGGGRPCCCFGFDIGGLVKEESDRRRKEVEEVARGPLAGAMAKALVMVCLILYLLLLCVFCNVYIYVRRHMHRIICSDRGLVLRCM